MLSKKSKLQEDTYTMILFYICRNTDMFMRTIRTKLRIAVGEGGVCSRESVCRGLRLAVTFYFFSYEVVTLYYYFLSPMCVCFLLLLEIFFL